MNGSSPIAKLVQQILDFIGQVFIFSLDDAKLLNNFIVSGFEPIKLTVEVATFFVTCINFGRDIICFDFPFSNDLSGRGNI